MDHPRPSAVPTTFAIIAVAGAALAVVGGTTLGIVGFGLVVAVVAGALAIAAARRVRPTAPVASPVTGRWWQFVVAGAGALVALWVITTITGELPEGGWVVAMTVLLAAMASLAAGAVLGLVHLGGARGRTAG